MATTGFTPNTDMVTNNLVVGKGLVTKNLCANGTTTIQKFDVQGSVFATTSASVTDLQSSGGQVGNLVSLQVAFTTLAQITAGAGITVATLGAGQAPFGNVTGPAISSTFIGGTLLVDSTGTLYLYASGSQNLAAGNYTGSVTYLI